MIIAFIFNVALFFILLSRKNLRKKHCVRLFLNLQVVHILFPAVLLGAFLHKEKCDEVPIHDILLSSVIIQLFLCLVVCTIDRLIAIKYPYRYEQVRSKHVAIIIVFLWVPAMLFIAITIAVETQDNYLQYINISVIPFAAMVLVSSNLVIYNIARKQYIA